jgi:flagella basal body P-ring formation protein FlgA
MGSLRRGMSANSGCKSGQFRPVKLPPVNRVGAVKKPLSLRPLSLRLTAQSGVGSCAKRVLVWSAPWLFSAAAAQTAISPEAQVPPAALARALSLASEAAQAVAPRAARVSVEAGRLDSRLVLAACARAEAYLPAGVAAYGHVRVGLRCTDGVTRWNIFLPVNVQVFAPALVVTSALAAGARLEASQIKLMEVDWSSASTPLFDNAQVLAGRVLARPLQAGQAVQAAHLQARQWFAQGDTVRVTAVGPGFSIVSEGQALTPGLEGKSAKVQTENGRILTGRPIGDRSVEVSL